MWLVLIELVSISWWCQLRLFERKVDHVLQIESPRGEVNQPSFTAIGLLEVICTHFNVKSSGGEVVQVFLYGSLSL